jgi:hypothetical protein
VVNVAVETPSSLLRVSSEKCCIVIDPPRSTHAPELVKADIAAVTRSCHRCVKSTKAQEKYSLL